jgi:hypothetical protein
LKTKLALKVRLTSKEARKAYITYVEEDGVFLDPWADADGPGIARQIFTLANQIDTALDQRGLVQTASG